MRKWRYISPAILALLPIAAHGAERVTLRNGFQMDCDHHRQAGERVRLYLNHGEDSYIEFPAEDIAGVEDAPESSPPTLPSQQAAAVSPAAPLPAAAAAQLSPSDLHQMLANAGREHNVDVDLLASVVKAESGGNPRAVSHAGARGLMQLMPATAAQLGVNDSLEAHQNVRGGSAYLDALLTRYRDNMALALAAYNAGPAAVDKYRGIPPYSETRAYVARVIHEFNRRVRARQAQLKQPPAPGMDRNSQR